MSTADRMSDMVFKAIAHPTRRGILALLSGSARSVKELTSEFEMSQPAISQHLKELRDAKLVASDRVGLEHRYRLTPRPLRCVVEWSEQYRTLIDPAGHAWSFASIGEVQGGQAQGKQEDTHRKEKHRKKKDLGKRRKRDGR